MAKSLPITANASLFLPVRNTCVKLIGLCAAAANATLEVYDGTIGRIATATIANGGTGYQIGDLLTLVQSASGVQAVFRVTGIDGNSPSASSSASASISVSASSSASPSNSASPSGSASPSSSASPSASSSVSPSSSASPSASESSSNSPSASPSSSDSPSNSPSASPSSSDSPSNSPSASPSSSDSPSNSPSTSPSSSNSPSNSPSTSPSSSASPSYAGTITSVELVSGGTGYAASGTYATTTDSANGADATITVSTIIDDAVSIGKLACVSNESAPPAELECLTTNGVSVRITGSSAAAYIVYD